MTTTSQQPEGLTATDWPSLRLRRTAHPDIRNACQAQNASAFAMAMHRASADIRKQLKRSPPVSVTLRTGERPDELGRPEDREFSAADIRALRDFFASPPPCSQTEWIGALGELLSALNEAAHSWRKFGKAAPQIAANLLACIEGCLQSPSDVAEANPNPGTPAGGVLLSDLLCVEIAMTGGIILRDLSGTATWEREGRSRLRSLLTELLEQEDIVGSPHAAVWQNLSEWTCSIARCITLLNLPGSASLPKSLRKLLSAFLEAVASFLTPSGFVMDPIVEADRRTALAKHLNQIRLTVAEGDEGPAVRLLTSFLRDSGVRIRKASKGETDEHPAWQSDASAGAVLRESWKLKSRVLAVNAVDDSMHLSLASEGTQLIHAPLQCDVTAEGSRLPVEGDWRCSCWFEEEEVSFAEFERSLTGGFRHVRQISLIASDHVAVIMDTIHGNQENDTDGAALTLSGSLTLPEGSIWERDDVTRELALRSGEKSYRFFPLWLPDDRVQSGEGEFSGDWSEEGVPRLSWSASGNGAIACPIVIDLKSRRSHHPADWSLLTVTDDRRRVAPFEAQGFRLRVGLDQWLFYRSFRQPGGLRAVLGLHTADETVVSRFTNEGEADTLVLVSGEL